MAWSFTDVMPSESTVVNTYPFFSFWAVTPAHNIADNVMMNIFFILINNDFSFSDPKFILFAPFGKVERPKNAIFAE